MLLHKLENPYTRAQHGTLTSLKIIISWSIICFTIFKLILLCCKIFLVGYFSNTHKTFQFNAIWGIFPFSPHFFFLTSWEKIPSIEFWGCWKIFLFLHFVQQNNNFPKHQPTCCKCMDKLSHKFTCPQQQNIIVAVCLQHNNFCAFLSI